MTLGPRTRKLLSIASGPLGDAPGGPPTTGRIGTELGELLAERNGWYAFESALHVFATGAAPRDAVTLEEWNAPSGWRSSYEGMADGCLFFAEDVFGVQFAVRDEAVVTFDPETAETKRFAAGIEDWADQVLADYDVLTGTRSRTSGSSGTGRSGPAGGCCRRSRSSSAASSRSAT